MTIAFNTPVLFRVIRRDEHWEFDCRRPPCAGVD